MSWVTLVWASVIGASATMALPHLLMGLQRRARENLFFALAAFSVAGVAAGELAIMHSTTPVEIGRALQLIHVPIFFLVIGIVGFVHFYFRSDTLWLGLVAIATRLLCFIINFASPPNLNFRAVTALHPLNVLGDTISMPVGISSPWTRLGELASLLVLAYVVDASIRLCRRGGPDNCRRAVVIGGSITVFIIAAAGLTGLTLAGVVRGPLLMSFPFVGVIIAMASELGYDIFRAARTARKLAVSEGALRESEARMSLAANAGDLALWTWNITTDEIWTTANGRNRLDLGNSEARNFAHFLAEVHPNDRPGIKDLVQKALAQGGEYESEYRLARSNGATVWMAGYGRVECDAEGTPVFLRGVTRDITKRKMAEEALRESEARFRTVADAAPVMIWMSNSDKEGIFFNKGWLEFTGRTLDQEMGTGWLKGIHPEDVAHTVDVCGIAFTRRETFTVEYRMRRHDGEYRWIIDTGTPRFDADGSFLGYIGSCLDIAERKQAELDHQLQSIELARVGRLALMGEMAASLAHEVFNPLAAMVTNASAGQRLLAQGELETHELRDLLGDIVADGHRARQVIAGIRNMVRRGDASHTEVDIADVVRDLLRTVRADSVVRKVQLVTEIDNDLGTVLGDRVQLLQVLLNLTLNAFDAVMVMRADARRVTVRAFRCSAQKVCVSVRDPGPGFPGGIAERLFEPFFSTKADGTGMGLAIARSIVDSHGGTLKAENSSEGGALFTVSLPRRAE